MLAQGGFHAVEIDASAADLDLPIVASEALQQPVRPLAHDVASSEGARASRAAVSHAVLDATSTDPMPQRDVGAYDHEFAHFPQRRGVAMLVDYGDVVAWQRVADRNAAVLTATGVMYKPLQHRRLRRRVYQLNRS